MAKRKRTRTRRSTRASSRRVSRRRTSNKNTMLMSVAGAMAYGAGREFISDKLNPITQRVPLGGLADEAVMGTVSYFMAKGKVPVLKNFPLARQFGQAGLAIEAARAGAYLADMATSGQSTMSTSSNSLTTTVF